MQTIKLNGKTQLELGQEIAGIVGKTAVVEGNTIRFEIDDVLALRDTAGDADVYWRRLGKTAKSKAAAQLREKFATIESVERYLEARS